MYQHSNAYFDLSILMAAHVHYSNLGGDVFVSAEMCLCLSVCDFALFSFYFHSAFGAIEMPSVHYLIHSYAAFESRESCLTSVKLTYQIPCLLSF